MATWTFKTAPTVSWDLRQPACGNNKLYYIDNRYKSPSGIDQNPVGIIYEYNPATDTLTAIFTPASQDADLFATWSLAWFKNNLYCALELDHGGGIVEGVVRRWDGTAENWTQVFSTGTSNVADRYIRIYTSDNTLVYYGRDWVDAAGQVFYSSNGSSWNTGSISGTQAGQSSYIELDDVVFWPLGIYERICVNDGGGASCTDTDIYKFDGTDLTIYQSSPADIMTQSVPNSEIHVANGGYNKMPLDMSSSTQIDPDTGGFRLMNANQYVLGGNINGNNTDLSTYNTGTDAWDSLETMTPDSGINPNFEGSDVWIGNGTSLAWLFGYNASTADYEIWERDEAFPLPATGDRLWIYKTDDGGQSWVSRGVKT